MEELLAVVGFEVLFSVKGVLLGQAGFVVDKFEGASIFGGINVSFIVFLKS